MIEPKWEWECYMSSDITTDMPIEEVKRNFQAALEILDHFFAPKLEDD